MKKCNHVWIEGLVDFGVSYTNAETNYEILAMVKRIAKLPNGFKQPWKEVRKGKSELNGRLIDDIINELHQIIMSDV